MKELSSLPGNQNYRVLHGAGLILTGSIPFMVHTLEFCWASWFVHSLGWNRFFLFWYLYQSFYLTPSYRTLRWQARGFIVSKCSAKAVWILRLPVSVAFIWIIVASSPLMRVKHGSACLTLTSVSVARWKMGSTYCATALLNRRSWLFEAGKLRSQAIVREIHWRWCCCLLIKLDVLVRWGACAFLGWILCCFYLFLFLSVCF